jgi:hypothetical protein
VRIGLRERREASGRGEIVGLREHLDGRRADVLVRIGEEAVDELLRRRRVDRGELHGGGVADRRRRVRPREEVQEHRLALLVRLPPAHPLARGDAHVEVVVRGGEDERLRRDRRVVRGDGAAGGRGHVRVGVLDEPLQRLDAARGVGGRARRLVRTVREPERRGAADLEVGVLREALEDGDQRRVLHRAAEVRERRASAGGRVLLVLEELRVGQRRRRRLVGAAHAVVAEERFDGLERTRGPQREADEDALGRVVLDVAQAHRDGGDGLGRGVGGQGPRVLGGPVRLQDDPVERLLS